MSENSWPVLGCGVGLRSQHYSHVTSRWPSEVDWFEVISENYMDTGGRPLKILEEVRKHYPIAMHGVALSIGSADELDKEYLKRLKTLADRIEPAVVSDHLCWSGVDRYVLHDLLPLPFTGEAVDYVADRIGRVQDFLGRRILIENVSSYVTYRHSVMPEWEFLTRVARRSGCGILLDLNNIYVNAKNHDFDPEEYVKSVPGGLVGQFHLAGHTDMGSFLFDTHSSLVIDPVWALYRKALELYGPVSTLVEWDEAIPEFGVLAGEVLKAREVYDRFRSKPKNPPASLSKSSSEPSRLAEAQRSLLDLERRMKTMIQPGVSKTPDAGRMLNPQGGSAGEERMSVYAGGYVARIHESLTETYAAVRHVTGAEPFAELAEAYAAAHPSRHYNLGNAGRYLADFLAGTPLAGKLPFLPDLARLEWLIAESFHAIQETSFDPSVLASATEKDWDSLKVLFQPSVKLTASHWPVLDIWSARTKPLDQLHVDLVNRPQAVLVYRQGVEVRCELVDPVQRRMIEELSRGKTLGQVCGELAEDTDEELPPVDRWFSRWAAAGLIQTCEFSKTSSGVSQKK